MDGVAFWPSHDVERNGLVGRQEAMQMPGGPRQFSLMHFAKARAAHSRIKQLHGPNAAARVAAARTLLEENERSPAGSNMAQVPGFAILIAGALATQQPIDVTPLRGMAAPASPLGDSN
jgi:hypothetical protein